MTVKEVNKENFRKEVVDLEIPVIVDFWAEWCGPCRMMAPVFSELSEEYENRLKFVKINTQEEQELSAMHNITGIPCMVVMKNGREINRIVGFMPRELLKEKIDSILNQIK